MDNYQELIMQAKLAMEQAYAPYSRFRAGAALLGAVGGYTAAATLKTQLIVRQFVLNEPLL